MSTIVTLENIIADEGRGWPYTAISHNLTVRQQSTHTANDGSTSSMRLVPTTGSTEATVTSYASFKLYATHLYYFSCKIKYEQDGDCTFDLYWPIAEPPAISHYQMNLAADTWGRMSGVFSRTNFTDGNYQYRFDYNNESNNIPMRVTSMMLFDLTEAFGAGNEPSKEWMDKHIDSFGDTLTVHYYDNLEDLFTNIADAIRTKNGKSDKIFACDFPDYIKNL